MTNPPIDARRVVRELMELAVFSDTREPAVTRVLFTPTDVAAREWLKVKFAEEELTIRSDPIGNIFARWGGKEPDLPAVGTGSHTDAIPHSGRYDGTVGVLGALEAIRGLRRTGFQPRRSIELLVFNGEEPTRFGIGCVGSRVLSGALEADVAGSLSDEEGETLERIRRAAGCEGELDDARLAEGYYRAFVELHIEQGPILEQENIAVGIVTAIAAPAALRVVYEGPGGHAGAVLMAERADSLLAASELVIAVETAALSLGGPDTVATTGLLDVHPGALNSIPSEVRLGIDTRDIEGDRRDRVLGRIRREARRIGEQRGQGVTLELINADPPAACDPDVNGFVEQACRNAGLSFKRLISRAYHDSLFMALKGPTSMIFIPCRNGVSHRPDEYASPEAIEAGTRALALTLAGLSEA